MRDANDLLGYSPTIPMGYDQPIPREASVVHVTLAGGERASIVARTFATMEDRLRCRLCRNHPCVATGLMCHFLVTAHVSAADAWLFRDDGFDWEQRGGEFVVRRSAP